MIISPMYDSATCFNAILEAILGVMGKCFYVINRIIPGCLEISNLFVVSTRISHLLASLTCEVS